jgi:hypothetical protein
MTEHRHRIEPAAELDLLGEGVRQLADGIALARAAEAVRTVFELADVDDALYCSVLRYPYVQVLRAGQPASPADYTAPRRVAGTTQALHIDGARARALFDEGNTLVFNALEEWHAPSRRIARQLAERSHARVQATAFCTPAGYAGFARHRDDVHVYAVQTVGSKRWTLSPPPEPDGFEPGLSKLAGAAPEFEVTTEQGSVLWMHRGVPHSAAAAEATSVHVSFTIRRPTLADVVRAELERELGALEHLHLAPQPAVARAQAEQAVARVQAALGEADWPARVTSTIAAAAGPLIGRPGSRFTEDRSAEGTA